MWTLTLNGGVIVTWATLVYLPFQTFLHNRSCVRYICVTQMILLSSRCLWSTFLRLQLLIISFFESLTPKRIDSNELTKAWKNLSSVFTFSEQSRLKKDEKMFSEKGKTHLYCEIYFQAFSLIVILKKQAAAVYSLHLSLLFNPLPDTTVTNKEMLNPMILSSNNNYKR